MIALLVRRLLHSAVALLFVAVFTYGVLRVLRPEEYPGQHVASATLHDVGRALLHLDFGPSCANAGCPAIRRLWTAGLASDLWMVGGGLLLGIGGGIAGGVWCATRPRTWSARLLEACAMVAYCAPVYVVGLLLLLLFDPDFAPFGLPWFFDARPEFFVSPPWQDPWHFLRGYLVPWFVVAAPLGAAVLRATSSMTLEELDADHIRTAIAKGLRYRRVIGRHAAPGAYASVASLVWAFTPTFVMNVILVEWVFNVQGFFQYFRRAIGQGGSGNVDVNLLQAEALWTAVLILTLSLLSDVALARIDPRVRASGALPG